MSELDKNTLKVLKYIQKHDDGILCSDVSKKFKMNRHPSIEDSFAYLSAHELVAIEHDFDSDGNPIAVTDVKITLKGRLFLQNNKLLTLDYIIKWIAIPLLIGIGGIVFAEIIKAFL